MHPPDHEVLKILSIEDNQADIFLLKKLFEETKTPVEVSFVGDGEEALKFLQKASPYQNAGTPEFILLDLNLPRKDGREFLKELKESPEYRHIPAFVLTTSKNEKDLQTCFELHANHYFVKPQELNEFRVLVRNILDLWARRTWLSATPQPKGKDHEL